MCSSSSPEFFISLMKHPSGHVKKKLRERGRWAGIQVQIRRASRSEIPRLDWRRPQFLLSGCGWKPVLTAAAAWVFLAGCSGLCRLRPYRCVLAACITVAQLETGQGVCCQSHCHHVKPVLPAFSPSPTNPWIFCLARLST